MSTGLCRPMIGAMDNARNLNFFNGHAAMVTTALKFKSSDFKCVDLAFENTKGTCRLNIQMECSQALRVQLSLTSPEWIFVRSSVGVENN